MVGYNKEDRVLLALDCIVFGFDEDELKILLIKRDFEPEKGKWSLMGGFMKQSETLDNAATRVLHNLTGIRNIYMEQLTVFSDLDRDPEERTVSVPYYALINIKEHSEELIGKYSAKWFPLNNIPNLIFDHNEMVDRAILRLRYRASTKPIGFKLLPDKFTMRQLRKLYEAIMDKKLDKRNFRSKALSLGILFKLDKKDKSTSKKGSYLYRFDQASYNLKMKDGFQFKL